MAADALEQSMLESKDKDQLLAIAQALGIKTNARAAKATLIEKILETTGVGSAPTGGSTPAAGGSSASSEAKAPSADEGEPEVVLGPDGEPLSDWELEQIGRAHV